MKRRSVLVATAFVLAASACSEMGGLSESGWSRDPVVRLSVAAQALQADDHCHFRGDRFTHAAEPVIWKNRGRIRLPLRAREARPRPPPIHGFRACPMPKSLSPTG